MAEPSLQPKHSLYVCTLYMGVQAHVYPRMQRREVAIICLLLSPSSLVFELGSLIVLIRFYCCDQTP